MRIQRRIVIGLCAVALAACSQPTSRPAFRADPDDVRAHLDALTAAELLGAGIGSPGEAAAMKYAADAFRASGLKTSTQAIPYVKIGARTSQMTLGGGSWTRTLVAGTDYVAWTRRPEAAVSVEAPIIFAGFGIVAPEFKWDDYKNTDVTGKVVLILDDVPRNGEHDLLGTLGETYYGRALYKFEEAARHGAAAVFIIHEDAPASDTWEEIRDSVAGEILSVDSPRSNLASITPIEGWLTGAAAAGLFQSAGLDFVHSKQLSHETNFTAEALPAKASVTVTGTLSRVQSDNVIGVVEGQTSEYVLVTSRWNRLGAAAGAGAAMNRPDDASGAAVMLEAAKALAQGPPPRRTIIFLVTTAHEDGLIGLKYYAEHPIFPMGRTVAHVHFDSADLHGEHVTLKTIGPIFRGLSTILKEAASGQGRLIQTEHDPDLLFYFRLSATAFAEQGIPEVDITTMRAMSMPSAPRPAPVGPPPPFDSEGSVRDADLLFNFVLAVSNASNWPTLRRPGSAAEKMH